MLEFENLLDFLTAGVISHNVVATRVAHCLIEQSE